MSLCEGDVFFNFNNFNESSSIPTPSVAFWKNFHDQKPITVTIASNKRHRPPLADEKAGLCA